MTKARAAIVLAAGQGTRMKSSLPKVLHPVAGRAMLDWAIDAATQLGCERIVVVVGAHAPEVRAAAEARLGPKAIAVQSEPLGTGHAVRAAEAALAGFDGEAIVTYADCPLLRAATAAPLFAALAGGADLAVLAFLAADPFGYGRLITGEGGALERIVEEKDASDAERAVRLCNSGVIAADAATLFRLLRGVRNENAKGEFYLTDIVALARAEGLIARVALASEGDVQGVNSKAELAAAEAAWQRRRRAELLAKGVGMIDPDSVFLSHDTEIAADVTLEPWVVFGPGVRIERGAVIRAFCHIEGAHVGPGASVGPFARLRPGASLGPLAKIGNFVEIKNATFAEGAQASHLAYIGDAEVGARANIGAGAITCNYDGFAKRRTVIGAHAFIGSNSALVAPVTIGAGAYTASGSVITDDVPEDALGIARARQEAKLGWAARFRSERGGAG